MGPPIPMCLVQQPLSRMATKTPCGEGELQNVANLVNPADPALGLQSVEKFGADNIADLILARTSGIFDYQRHNLENLFICPKHLNEIVKDWKRSERNMFSHGERVAKCGI